MEDMPQEFAASICVTTGTRVKHAIIFVDKLNGPGTRYSMKEVDFGRTTAGGTGIMELDVGSSLHPRWSLTLFQYETNVSKIWPTDLEKLESICREVDAKWTKTDDGSIPWAMEVMQRAIAKGICR